MFRYIKEHVSAKKLCAWSDACGGQNRNIKVALLWMYLVSLDSCPIEEIEHKFCVSGHSYLPNDRDFSQIENKLRKIGNMYSYEEFCNVVASCKQNKNKFKVVKMTAEEFYSTEALQMLITNRKKDSKKNKVNWLNMKVIRVVKSKPGILFFKYSYDPDTPYLELDLKKRLGGPLLSEANMALLHPNGHFISRAKYNDILCLLKYVPPVCHDFFVNLVVDDKSAIDTDFDLISEDED